MICMTTACNFNDSLMTYLFVGRSKGWGIVEFETPDEAVRAINELNGIELGGRTIIVREDREDRDVKVFNQENGIEPIRGGRGRGRGRGGRGREAQTGEPAPPGTQVVVHGLPWSYTDDDLRQIFEGSLNIVKCEVAIGRDGRSRGYGVVQFGSNQEASDAIDQYNGKELEGRNLSVKFDSFA